MEIFQDIWNIFFAPPIWFATVSLTGLIVGYITRKIYFDIQAVFAIALVIAPFVVGRVAAIPLFNYPEISKTGLLETFLFVIYVLMVFIGRRLGKAEIL